MKKAVANLRQPFSLKVEVAFAVIIGDILYHLSEHFEIGRILAIFYPNADEVT